MTGYTASGGHAARNNPRDDAALQRQIEQIDLVALASRYTKLTRQGNYKYAGNCPVHGDSGSGRPNFYVYLHNGRKQDYHCYACGSHGDAITFVQAVQHSDWDAACRELNITFATGSPAPARAVSKASKQVSKAQASSTGAATPPPAPARDDVTHDVPTGAGKTVVFADVVSEHLLFGDGGKLDEFTAWRGLSLDTVATWRVGYTDKLRVKCGEQWQDVAAWLIPIYDKAYHTVSIRYRIADDDTARAGRKYHTVAGGGVRLAWYLHGTDEPCNERGSLLICEGELDAMAAWQAGYDAVATAGTSNIALLATAMQAGELAEYDRLYLAFDGDDAGYKASSAAIDTLAPIADKLRRVAWPNASDDVNSYVQAGGSLATLLAAAAPARVPKHIFPNLGEFLTRPLPVWLVPNELYTKSVILLYGASGQGKTFVELDYNLRLAVAGKQVLYIASEAGASVGKRIAAWLHYHGKTWQDVAGKFIIYDKPVNVYDASELDELQYSLQAQGIKPVLITIDTMGASMAGAEENSNDDMHIIVSNCKRLAAACSPASIMLVHHTGKNEARGPRGGEALSGDVDIAIECSKSDELITLTHKKMRDDVPEMFYRRLVLHTAPYYDSEQEQWINITTLVATPTEYIEQVAGDVPTIVQATILDVLSYFAGGAVASELAEAAHLKTGPTLHRPVNAMITAGWVEQADKRGAPYKITEDGRAALARYRKVSKGTGGAGSPQVQATPVQATGWQDDIPDDDGVELPATGSPAPARGERTIGGVTYVMPTPPPRQSSLHDAAVAERERRREQVKSEQVQSE